jgi:hypothetical protein
MDSKPIVLLLEAALATAVSIHSYSGYCSKVSNYIPLRTLLITDKGEEPRSLSDSNPCPHEGGRGPELITAIEEKTHVDMV